MNALGSYLARQKLGFAEFARRIGVEDTTVMRWANGDRTPAVDFAVLIERATEGLVPVSSWAAARSRRRGLVRRAGRRTRKHSPKASS